VDNVLNRPLFKFNQGGSGLGKMQNALIRAGYDKSYVFRLGPTQVIDLYDYLYGSGEGKDYSAPTPKMEGGPVKLAEGTIPRYQAGPSTFSKLFTQFMQPPGEEVLNRIRKEAKTYYFNAMLPPTEETGSYTMKQMEAADKKATELAEMDVMKFLENFKEPAEDPILKYRDRFSEDEEYGFPSKVLRREQKFGNKLLEDPKFFGPDSMMDMEDYRKERFGPDAPTNKYLMSLPKETRDAVMQKYVAQDAQYDIEDAERAASNYMKRRYGLAEGGMPNTTENVGIMDGVGVGAEALMAQEQAIDQAQDIGGLMSAIRGKPINEEEARGELAELVGPEDAQQTPESVLALVQPVMELAKGQGIAQFVEEAEMPEQQMMAQGSQTMAQGGPVKMQIGGMPPGMESILMQGPGMPSGMMGPTVTEEDIQVPAGQTQDTTGQNLILSNQGMAGVPDLSDPLLSALYQSKLPMYQDIYGNQKTDAAKANILFQIAQIGLGLARAPQPGEPADLMSRISLASAEPIANIGKIAQGIETAKNQADTLAKAGALGAAEAQYLKALDADLELQKAELEGSEIKNFTLSDIDGRKQAVYTIGGTIQTADLGPANKTYNNVQVVDLEDGKYWTWLDADGNEDKKKIGNLPLDKVDPDFFQTTSGQYLYLDPKSELGFTVDPGYVNKNGVLMLRQPNGEYLPAENITEYQKLASRKDAFIEPDQKVQAENLEGVTTVRSAMTAGEDIINGILKNSQAGSAAIAGTSGYINRMFTQALNIGKDLTQGNFLNAVLSNDENFQTRLDQTLTDARKGLNDYSSNLGKDATEGDQQAVSLAQELLTPTSEGILVSFDTETYQDQFGNSKIRITNKQYKTLKDFGGDTEMFKNQVRINALAYGLARSRKSNGRLNLDDLQRASKAINLDTGSQKGILAGLVEAVNELARNGEKFISGYYQAGGTQVNPDWEVFGLNPDQQKALKTQITKEGVFGKFFPDVDVDLGERVTATPKSYNIEDFIIGTQGNMNVEEVVQKTQEAPVLTLDDLASQYGLGGGLQ